MIIPGQVVTKRQQGGWIYPDNIFISGMFSQKVYRRAASLVHGPAFCSPEPFTLWDHHKAQKSCQNCTWGGSLWNYASIPGAAWLDPPPSCLPCSRMSWAYQAPLMLLFSLLSVWQEGQLLSHSPFQFGCSCFLPSPASSPTPTRHQPLMSRSY